MTLREQVDSLDRALVKIIRTETNYQDGCRNTFCTSSFNPNRKYYLDHAHVTIYFSLMIRILLPLQIYNLSPSVGMCPGGVRVRTNCCHSGL